MGSSGKITRIVLFDGVCNLCNNSVLFIIKRDPLGQFQFASLQSSFGKQQLYEFGLSASVFNSVLLVENKKLYQKSTAAIKIASRLGGLWPLMSVFWLVPPFIRNLVYDWIAANRYKWFGKKEACMIPTPELKSRFIG